ncbi:DUF2637 domain-containing protein [Streptomyces sp. CAU 1734]|uniref:DUF2637 domain-containing protein n=1 Tax=Streptomyces sp. CAU 1734 TaxID=3140360 RepID=UPI003260A33A
MRRIRVDAVLIQAVIAAALSFAHLHDLAAAAGQDGWKAWLYPISVDLLLVAAWRRLRSGAAGKASGWCWFLISLAASLGANIATAGLLDLDSPPDWLRVLVAGWPAIAFLGGTLLVHTTTPAPGVEDDEDEAGSAGTRDPHPTDTSTPEREPAPTLPAPPADTPAIEPPPEPQPEEEPASALVPVDPTPPVPVALVDHARTIAADYRARTGFDIDTDTLRTRLGVPPAMASAIAAQLA